MVARFIAPAVPKRGTGVDGSEFAEYSFGGNGTADSLTGTHHILTIVVISMASAHSTPTSGGENKAAIVAQIDPVDAGSSIRTLLAGCACLARWTCWLALFC